MDLPGLIYLAVNSVNGKMYVGQTSRELHTRIQAHDKESRDKRRTVFSKAIAKYGIEYFAFSIVETCDRSELNALEILWIAVYDTLSPKGYNVTAGGGGTRGLTGDKSANFGKTWRQSPSAIQKMIDFQNRPEVLEANKLRGATHNPLCDPAKREWALENLRKVATGQWADPVQRAKKLDGIRRAWQDPGVRAKRLAVPNSGRFKPRGITQCAQ